MARKNTTKKAAAKSSSSSSSSLINKYSDSSTTLKQQLDTIDNQMIDLNKQRDAILERLSFNEVNIQNIMQQDTPSLSYLSNELIKIILSYMNANRQDMLLDINKHYRSYKMMTCYYKFNKKRSYEYLMNQHGMRYKIESSVANPNKQISLTFRNKSIPDVSALANVHSLTLNSCTGVRDVNYLQKLGYLDLTGTRGIKDISALVNMDTLKLISCNKKIATLPSNLNVKHLTLGSLQMLGNIQGLSNCTSLTIEGGSFKDCSVSNLACLTNINTVTLNRVSICPIIDGWRNQKLALSYLSIQEIKNLQHMASLDVERCGSLKTIEDIDGVEKIKIYDCSNLLKIDRVSNTVELDIQGSYYYGNEQVKCKEMANLKNIDKLTLSSIGALTTFTNVSNLREVNISSCSSLRDLSPLTHPQAKVEVLVLASLHIVNLDVQGRIPDVTLNRCNSIINVSGLVSCRKLTIEQCSSITDVSALGLVDHLTLDYNNHFDIKTFQGLAALGRVRELTLKGIDMVSLNLDCYVDVQKLSIFNCLNVNMPLDTLNLLTTDRDPESFSIKDCSFDDQSNNDIQHIMLSSELEYWQDKIYFRDNNARRPVVAPLPATASTTVPSHLSDARTQFNEDSDEDGEAWINQSDEDGEAWH